MSVLPTLADREQRLAAAQSHQLADVPPEAEWLANLDNPRARRAYQIDLRGFMRFTAITRAEDFRVVTRVHVLAWFVGNNFAVNGRSIFGFVAPSRLSLIHP